MAPRCLSSVVVKHADAGDPLRMLRVHCAPSTAVPCTTGGRGVPKGTSPRQSTPLPADRKAGPRVRRRAPKTSAETLVGERRTFVPGPQRHLDEPPRRLPSATDLKGLDRIIPETSPGRSVHCSQTFVLDISKTLRERPKTPSIDFPTSEFGPSIRILTQQRLIPDDAKNRMDTRLLEFAFSIRNGIDTDRKFRKGLIVFRFVTPSSNDSSA